MPPRKARPAVEDRIRAELQAIRACVVGVHGSIAATSDGMLVAHDVPDLEPTQIAALVATTFALTSRATVMTGRGQFREAVARGSDGYLAVYAAGETGIVAVIGTTDLNVGMLQYQARGFIERVAEYAAEFGKFATPPTQPRPAAATGGGRPRPDARADGRTDRRADGRTGDRAGGRLGGGPDPAEEAAPALPARRASARSSQN